MAENRGWECDKCKSFSDCHYKFCGMCGKQRNTAEISGVKPYVDDFGVNSNEMRFVIIGKTGAGKSATGNTLLGRPYFETVVSGESVTKICTRGEALRFDKKLMVVDTPGVFDTGMSNEQVTKEITKCIGMTSPGIHAFLLVIRAGRFTKEEQKTIELFAKHFGEQMFRHMIIVFTGKDDLEREGISIDAFIKDVPDVLTDILTRCQYRYVAFNNIKPPEENGNDVRALLRLTEKILQQNNGMCYTDETYAQAEKAILRRMDKIRVEEETYRDMEIQKLREQFEQQIREEKQKKKRDEEEYKNRLQAMEKAISQLKEECNNKIVPATMRNRVRDECEGDLEKVFSGIKMVVTGLISFALEIGKAFVLKRFF